MDSTNEPTVPTTDSSAFGLHAAGGQSPAGGSGEAEPVRVAVTAPDDGVERPEKVLRIGAMTHQLLEEVRRVSLDEEGRRRLQEIHRISLDELAGVLSDELREELSRLTLPLEEDGAPTQNELQLAQAQLEGWLQGVFQGIQATLAAQQIAAQSQLAQMQRSHQEATNRGRDEAAGRAYL